MMLPQVVNHHSELLKSLNKYSIKYLRLAGYKVFVRHRRYYGVKLDFEECMTGPWTKKEAESYGYNHRDLLSRGGFTDVEIFYKDNLICQGGAKCSLNDNFVKSLGRKIALGRALSKIGIDSKHVE